MSLSILAERLNTIIATDPRPAYSITISGQSEDGDPLLMTLSVENGAATLMVLNNGSPDDEFIELNPCLFTAENLTELLLPSFRDIPADIKIVDIS
jgi:hypothetical protein